MDSPIYYYLIAVNSKSQHELNKKVKCWQWYTYALTKVAEYAASNNMRVSGRQPRIIGIYDLRAYSTSPNVALLRAFLFNLMKETLCKKVWNEKQMKYRKSIMTQKDIAILFNCDKATVSRTLRKYNDWEATGQVKDLTLLKEALLKDYGKNKWYRSPF